MLSHLRRFPPLATLAAALIGFYLFRLGGVGVLGPDEPRYAAIGRAMAHTGDLITPRLWGAPWFEKPPLVYWMTAFGAAAGLNPDLSGRLPVALLSLLFLAVCFTLLRHEFGIDAAAISTALLATSAGWITYSQLCLTDLPLAVFFSLAVFLALPLLRAHPPHPAPWRWMAIGIALAFAALAKGLVPVALALPFVWFLRCYWRAWWITIAAFLVVALPWYLAVYAKNGYPFIRDLFIRHHFERLYSASLQHVQPWYYYVPVLIAGLFPWTPLFALLASGDRSQDAPAADRRRAFLISVVVFGFLLFSATLNKLPGYLLPLLPSLFALLGARFESRRLVELSRWWLLPSALLIAAIPLLASVLPASLSAGRLSLSAFKPVTRVELFYIAVPIAVLFLARRSWAGALLVLCAISGGIYLKNVAYPQLDANVSSRGLWREVRTLPSICDGGITRDWKLGLSFYRDAVLPPCTNGNFAYALRPRGHQPPVIERLSH